MSNTVNLSGLDPSLLPEEIKNKLNAMCESVYDKKLAACTNEEVQNLIELDMNVSIKKMTVNVMGSRQVEQYTPNTYGGTLDIHFEDSYNLVMEKVSQQKTAEGKVATYIRLRSLLFTIISNKFKNSEAYLRDLCREAEERDGIKPVGRYVVVPSIPKKK